MTIQDLLTHYESRKDEIRARLAEFPKVYEAGDIAIFKELCFCILTANTSAKMGITCIEAAGDEVVNADLEGIQNALCGRYRFWRVRPAYIIHTREYLKHECNFKLKDKLDSLTDFQERRDFFAANPGIKGIGYKEASHFLRNIGYKGYAILDKHIVNMLFELGVLPDNQRPNNRKKYLAIEERLREFCAETGIDMDEMDLALWSYKTGVILK
ncbi:MAG: N-glycosylase/DNA lyase [Nitrospirae bacterium]|nr:N-glycosylase/DNA lyase [Nitrospirota bacterium]